MHDWLRHRQFRNPEGDASGRLCRSRTQGRRRAIVTLSSALSLWGYRRLHWPAPPSQRQAGRLLQVQSCTAVAGNFGSAAILRAMHHHDHSKRRTRPNLEAHRSPVAGRRLPAEQPAGRTGGGRAAARPPGRPPLADGGPLAQSERGPGLRAWTRSRSRPALCLCQRRAQHWQRTVTILVRRRQRLRRWASAWASGIRRVQ